MIQRYILTGAPGAGKTAILEGLRARGHAVVEEAAHPVIAEMTAEGIAEPWGDPAFTDRICALQAKLRAAETAPVQFHDRSPVCTLALARHLPQPVSPALAAEAARARDLYQQRVFLIEPLGFIVNTEARRISYEDALKFEAVHIAAYEELGFELIRIPPGMPEARAEQLLSLL
ncbi:MAG: AAA family ATPase [Caulobacteraceae bacterium]